MNSPWLSAGLVASGVAIGLALFAAFTVAQDPMDVHEWSWKPSKYTYRSFKGFHGQICIANRNAIWCDWYPDRNLWYVPHPDRAPRGYKGKRRDSPVSKFCVGC